MNATKILSLISLFLLAVFVVLLASRASRPPYLPENVVHEQSIAPADCLTCHGLGAPNARSAEHPPANDCMRCHARRD